MKVSSVYQRVKPELPVEYQVNFLELWRITEEMSSIRKRDLDEFWLDDREIIESIDLRIPRDLLKSSQIKGENEILSSTYHHDSSYDLYSSTKVMPATIRECTERVNKVKREPDQMDSTTITISHLNTIDQSESDHLSIDNEHSVNLTKGRRSNGNHAINLRRSARIKASNKKPKYGEGDQNSAKSVELSNELRIRLLVHLNLVQNALNQFEATGELIKNNSSLINEFEQLEDRTNELEDLDYGLLMNSTKDPASYKRVEVCDQSTSGERNASLPNYDLQLGIEYSTKDANSLQINLQLNGLNAFFSGMKNRCKTSTFKFQGICWYAEVRVKIIKADMKIYKYLALHLVSERHNRFRNYECSADLELRLVSKCRDVDDVTEKFENVLFHKRERFAYNRLISYKKLIDGELDDYVCNDSISLIIHLKADKPTQQS